MKKLFGVLAPVTLCVLLGGCGVTECMDALLPRHSAPLRGSHTFQVIYKGRNAISTTISCERYYDASCSDRGNFWRLREIGLNSHPWLVNFVTIQDPDVGEIKIPRPSCEMFVEQIPKEFDKMILVNGETYFYSSKSTLSDGYVFVKRKFAMQKVDQVHAKSVILKFIIKIDGKPLLPPENGLH